MSTVRTKRLQAGYEPIEGYVLEKRIGRGGYGEVWRAVAPGGLKKAVKFVYGQKDERRAAQELKSLERIKGVQHPFILTLERFELIDNQLVIVTELAEGSLEDVYKQHQERGSCGIPRDALLGYMKDVADALDYLHQLYKLQHLDIKPANLLMVGGRVKVADFGLLKDLADVECSLVGGLTPIYAPPEVFDGRPSMHSDQYSLAVMYQEMLTSSRPFSGRTIAQLATQHVHNTPNLKPLPASDRPCVARALEKSPDRRFESCSDFVERLLNPHGRRNESQPIDTQQPETPAAQVENLPRLSGVADGVSGTDVTQTLVVALGGTGADCLNQLRSRVEEYGAKSPMVLHSVLIDTDVMMLQTARMIDPTETTPRCHTIDVPLRSPNDYRASGTQRLRSISRRWIYNVPRTLSTGGMRPLGRLALVDHSQKVLDGLKAAVEELRASLAPGESPRVYVVGSLTGGSGSGMYLDVAYLLRHLLDESALENESIVSFLTTNRFQGDPSKPIALHATKSAVAEFAHFLNPGNSYPGDAGVGWPSVPAARTPLSDAYIVAQSDRPNAPSTLESVVNYLWLDATVCGEWFSTGRNDSDESALTATTRTMSIVQIGDPGERKASLLAPQAAKRLLLQWLGNPKESDEAAQDFARRIIRRCYLHTTTLQGQTLRWFGGDRQDRVQKLESELAGLDPSVLKNPRKTRTHLVEWLTRAMELDRNEVVAGQLRQQIEREINLRLQDGRLNLSSAIAGIESLCDSLNVLQLELTQNGERELMQLDDSSQKLKAESEEGISAGGRVADLQAACELGEQLVDVVALKAAAAIVSELDEELSKMVEDFTEASARVAQGIQILNEDASLSEQTWYTVNERTRDQLPQILGHIHDQSVATQLLRTIQHDSTVSPEVLVTDLTTIATELIRDAIAPELLTTASDSQLKNLAATVTLDGQAAVTEPDATHCVGLTTELNRSHPIGRATQTHSWDSVDPLPSLSAAAAVDAVRPPLLECGGQQRLYLVCRDETEKTQLLKHLPDSEEFPITTVLAQTSMPMLVHEARGIELKGILSWLDALTGDDGKISGRLATRCDVDWT